MQKAFAGIVDYAGLFPPASLGMAESLRNYQSYLSSPDRWMLGRYVVAAMRLREMHETLLSEGIAPSPSDPWRLSMVFGNIIPNEMKFVDEFHSLRSDGSVVIDAVEFRVSTAGQIHVVSRDLPQGIDHFLEVPQDGPFEKLIRTIGEQQAKAKYRTGGSTPELFPPAASVIQFIQGCIKYQVPFKFTAGLHHPFRGSYPLTYKPDAEFAPMFGFVPLLLATAEIARGGNAELAMWMIEDDDPAAFGRRAGGFIWREMSYSVADIELARRVFLGFGSCSFREPLDGIAQDAP